MADASEREQVSGRVVGRGRVIMAVVVVVKSGFLLTSRGVPGMEPYVELLRVLGGVRMRRPNLSNLAGEAVREAKEPEPVEPTEPVRWWFRGPGRTFGCSEGLAKSADGVVELSVLLALTRATALRESCNTD